mmetsp:Transcript_60491/g.159970  ORF Transcript_60491/g.159970 Transcript_60491/m.159970 type:complete len:202 (+) Transcript_60491:216-821(+)
MPHRPLAAALSRVRAASRRRQVQLRAAQRVRHRRARRRATQRRTVRGRATQRRTVRRRVARPQASSRVMRTPATAAACQAARLQAPKRVMLRTPRTPSMSTRPTGATRACSSRRLRWRRTWLAARRLVGCRQPWTCGTLTISTRRIATRSMMTATGRRRRRTGSRGSCSASAGRTHCRGTELTPPTGTKFILRGRTTRRMC